MLSVCSCCSVWMLTGDKRETAKNIALACMLIDPDMEASSDLLGSLAIEDMNRVIEITGDWVTMCNNNDQLRQLFDILDCGGDVVDGYRTGYISKEELRLFLVGLRVPGMDDDRTFDAHWHLVESVNGRIAFGAFSTFIRNLQPSHLKAVQTDIELGLRKARLIAGDGTEEEKRERLEKTPISLVVEGEAFSVFYPDTKVRKELAEPAEPASRVGRIFGGGSGGSGSAADRQRAIARRQQEEDDHDFSEPEALLLRETFFELASMAKSVICCRLTPAQKGKIVQEFSKRHVTLAIGDGGNDELMIKRASIGVGIAGLEGTAASRASDYAIGSFRFLHTLLFVHGYWCCRRIAKLTLFIFYKAALVAFSMYLFGFYSAFSGQQCLAPDTEIAMADGTTKRASDVRVGDLLVGREGAVKVLSAVPGSGKQLYRITDDSGDSHVVTRDHLVTVGWRVNPSFTITELEGREANTMRHREMIVVWWERDTLKRREQRFRVRRSDEQDVLGNVEGLPPVVVRDTDEEFIAYGRQWLASQLTTKPLESGDLIEIQADRLALLLPLLDGSNPTISNEPLIRLQLVPLPPRQAESIATPDPVAGSITIQHLTGFRHTTSTAIELGDGVLCHEFAQVMELQSDGTVGYRAIRRGDKIRTVFMVSSAQVPTERGAAQTQGLTLLLNFASVHVFRSTICSLSAACSTPAKRRR